MKKIVFLLTLLLGVFVSCNDKKDDAKPAVVETEIPFSIIGTWEEQRGNTITFNNFAECERNFDGWSAYYTYAVFKNKINQPYIQFVDKSIWKIKSRWDIQVLDTNKFCQVQYPKNVFTRRFKKINNQNIPKSDFEQ
jgi:hypothetical protein